jgi:hypothetical protein
MRINYINCTQDDETCECGSVILPATIHTCIKYEIPNDYELVCKAYKKLNLYLQSLGANLNKSINITLKNLKRNNLINDTELNAINYIVKERNKVIHESLSRLENKNEFIKQCNYLFLLN